MLLKAYELIQKLQKEIGDDAEITLRVCSEPMQPIGYALEIRVDWWKKDFHTRRQISEIEMKQISDENLLINHFVGWCKHEYARGEGNKMGLRSICSCGHLVSQHYKSGCWAERGFYDYANCLDTTHRCDCQKSRSELLKPANTASTPTNGGPVPAGNLSTPAAICG